MTNGTAVEDEHKAESHDRGGRPRPACGSYQPSRWRRAWWAAWPGPSWQDGSGLRFAGFGEVRMRHFLLAGRCIASRRETRILYLAARCSSIACAAYERHSPGAACCCSPIPIHSLHPIDLRPAEDADQQRRRPPDLFQPTSRRSGYPSERGRGPSYPSSVQRLPTASQSSDSTTDRLTHRSHGLARIFDGLGGAGEAAERRRSRKKAAERSQAENLARRPRRPTLRSPRVACDSAYDPSGSSASGTRPPTS